MTAHDPRTLRSRASLVAASIEMLDEQELAGISITDVCSRAGVSRPTFYLHFGDVGALVQAAALERLEALFNASREAEQNDAPGTMLEAGIHRLLYGLAEHAPFYRRVLDGASAVSTLTSVIDFVAARLVAFAQRSGSEGAAVPASRVRFFAAGATWLVVEHLGTGRLARDDLDRAAAEIARHLAGSTVEVVG